jgi:hypothetical protein
MAIGKDLPVAICFICFISTKADKCYLCIFVNYILSIVNFDIHPKSRPHSHCTIYFYSAAIVINNSFYNV